MANEPKKEETVKVDPVEEQVEEKPQKPDRRFLNTSSTKVDISNGIKSISINAGESDLVPMELLYPAQSHPSLVQ